MTILGYIYEEEESPNTDTILDVKFYQNYFAVKFFESITRAVAVQKNGELHRVLFTLHPFLKNLSTQTKNNFEKHVNRETRYSKLLSLMEYSEFFYDEIKYNNEKFMNNKLLSDLNGLDINILELISFGITLLINLYMISVYEVKYEKSIYISNNTEVVKYFSIIQILFNCLIIISWFVTKYDLHYIIETKKYLIKRKSEEDYKLTLGQKLVIACYYSVIFKNEINFCFFNIILSSVSLIDNSLQFILALQMLLVINLTENMKNIVRAVTNRMDQLLITVLFIVIFIYAFTIYGFYNLNDNFYFFLEEEVENFCTSLVGCFLAHLNEGFRIDGGIGELMKMTPYYVDSDIYLSLFLFQIFYVLVIVVVLISVFIGIVIDTYIELRERTQVTEEDKSNVCFICGDSKENLEKNNINFVKHRTIDHNMWNYADYMVGLKFVDPQEVNAINSFVISKISEKSIAWIPLLNK